MPRARFFFFIFLLFLLSGCFGSTLVSTQDVCADLNWYELGRSDGVRGRPSLHWQKRVVECKGFADSEHRLYINGWYAGVDEFCSLGHGYHFGKTGQTYYEVCPKSKEEEFLQSYQAGIKAYLYERSIERLSEKVKDLEIQVKESSLGNQRSLLQEKLSSLRGKQNRHRSALLVIESKMKQRAL